MKINKRFSLNSKGLLFTIMTLFLIFGIITLNEALSDTARGYSPSSETISLYSISNTYQNAASLMYNLDKSGYAKYSMKNVFPIDPTIDRDNNTSSISQNFSIDQNQINAAFDYLNLTRIFIEEKSHNYYSTGTLIDINSPKNRAWDVASTNNSLSFIMLPFCYAYTIIDTTSSKFSTIPLESPCKENITLSKMKQIDINIVLLSSTIDFNSITCNSETCPAYTGTTNNYNLKFDTTNCPSCLANKNKLSIPFSSTSKIEVRGATTPALIINISGTDINFSYSSEKKVGIYTKFYFNQQPTGIVIKDVSILVNSESNTSSKQSN